jgi:hypothetical protein
MKSINLKSVLISGLIAGLIINISGITMVPVVGDQMTDVLSSRGLPPLGTSSMLFFSFVSFVFGLSLVFLYSILIPHLRSRIKAALISSLIVWFIAYFLANVSLAVYGFMPLRLVIIGTIWGLGELLIAGLAGMRLYKD